MPPLPNAEARALEAYRLARQVNVLFDRFDRLTGASANAGDYVDEVPLEAASEAFAALAAVMWECARAYATTADELDRPAAE